MKVFDPSAKGVNESFSLPIKFLTARGGNDDAFRVQSTICHPRSNRGYFRAMLENRSVGLGPLPKEPEYGTRQPEVTKRMMEAWNWLERQGLLIHNDQQVADWFIISSDGEKLLTRNARYERWEKLGLDRVKSDLTVTGGMREVGGVPEVRDMAWEWVRMKENKPPVKPAVAGEWVLIADSRLDELRALTSSQFDFRKLIRLCEELNIVSREECHFACPSPKTPYPAESAEPRFPTTAAASSRC